jgi:hypothetical protein
MAGSAACAMLGFRNPPPPFKEMKDSAKMAINILSASLENGGIFLIIGRLLFFISHTKTQIAACHYLFAEKGDKTGLMDLIYLIKLQMVKMKKASIRTSKKEIFT